LTVRKLKNRFGTYANLNDYEEATSRASLDILESLMNRPSIEAHSMESYLYMIASRRLIDLKRGTKRLVFPEKMPVTVAEKPKSDPLSIDALPSVLNDVPDEMLCLIDLKYRVLPSKILKTMSLSAINRHQNQPCLNYKSIARQLGVEKEGALRQRFSRLKPLLKARLTEVA
jgi:hypothetical protein